MEEQDITNFSNSSSSHRLPTISASEALKIADERSRGIPTNLPTLDAALQPNLTTPGLSRGSVTELYGPPGVGKTTFALQLAVNALHTLSPSNGVVWIDTGAPLPGPRFNEIFSAYQVPSGHDPPSSPPKSWNEDELIDKISYFSPQTLAHLLVLFLHPTAKFPPAGTSLIVVDNISALFTTSFPRHTKSVSNQSFADAHRHTTVNKAANRKWAIAGDLASAMSKMASLKNVVILVINQVSTSVKGARKATLKPMLTGREWDAGIRDRIMLYRDFAPRDGEADLTEEERKGLRFAEVVKAGGKMQAARTQEITTFVIGDHGLQEIKMAASPAAALAPDTIDPMPKESTHKRKADEIADSEDEGDEVGSENDLGLFLENLDDVLYPMTPGGSSTPGT